MDYNNPNAINNIPEHGSTRGNTCTETQPLLEKPPQSVILDFRQWQEGACGAFRPSAKTIPALPSGVYTPEMDQYGPFLLRKNIAADDLLELPDSVNASVLAAMGRFWASRDRYVKHGLLYKRGLLLWGPPGSGKTATVQLVIAQLLKQGGIVVLADNPRLLEILLAPIRQIEPARNLIVVLEDIDEIINSHGEKSLLSLLDGEAQVDNIVYLATTNYPDRLGARIVNRPSRFDERIFVGMPSAVARRSYLDRVAGEKFGLPPKDSASRIFGNLSPPCSALTSNTMKYWAG